jgi:hypothetical protein
MTATIFFFWDLVPCGSTDVQTNGKLVFFQDEV